MTGLGGREHTFQRILHKDNPFPVCALAPLESLTKGSLTVMLLKPGMGVPYGNPGTEEQRQGGMYYIQPDEYETIECTLTGLPAGLSALRLTNRPAIWPPPSYSTFQEPSPCIPVRTYFMKGGNQLGLGLVMMTYYRSRIRSQKRVLFSS